MLDLTFFTHKHSNNGINASTLYSHLLAVFIHYYRPQRSWAKVIFFTRVCDSVNGGGVVVVWARGVVSNFSGGGCFQFLGGLQFFGGVSNFSGGSSKFFFFSFFFQIFFFPKFLLGCTNPRPPPKTVNARPVRILLECILV